MRRTAHQRAATALVASVAILAAAAVTAVTTAQTLDCELYDSEFEAGNLGDDVTTVAEENYYGCADDGGFLVAAEGTQDEGAALEALSWTCSGGGTIGSTSSGSFAGNSASFTVGITKVRTSISDGDFPILGDVEIGGYDLNATGTGVSFSWKGHLGELGAANTVLPGTESSDCGNTSFATGVTVWSSSSYVYGIILECANVTATCAPPDYPANLLEEVPTDGSSSPAPTQGPSSDASSDSAEGSRSFAAGAIVGASVGGAVLLIAVAAGGTCWIYRRRHRPSESHGPDKSAPGIAGEASMSGAQQAECSGWSTPPTYADLVG